MTADAVDQYAFWRRSLAGHKMPMHDGLPQPGFYRLREHDGVDGAVAYWIEDDGGHPAMRALVNGKIVPSLRATELWSFVCDKPVSHGDYTHRIKHGRWPNESPVLTGQVGVGHNRPPADNSMDGLTSVLDAIAAEAKRMLDAGPATSQDEVDHASDIANELGDVEKRATMAHKSEKAPLITAGKLVDAKWFPLRDRAADLKSKIKLRVVTPFLARLKREQEAALAAAQAQGVDTAGMEEKVRAGSMRRTSALKKIKSARIDDYDAALAFFKNHPEVKEIIQRLADRATRAGMSVPGCATVEIEQAV